jgi:hypothetical protein
MTAVPACRFGDRCELETYEQAIECLGSHSQMSRTEIAHRVAQLQPGRSEAYLRSCLSPNDGTHNLQLAIAPVFTIASGNPALLLWHARTAGYGIHKLPSAAADRHELLLSLTDVFDAVGDLARGVKAATVDRAVNLEADPREVAR